MRDSLPFNMLSVTPVIFVGAKQPVETTHVGLVDFSV